MTALDLAIIGSGPAGYTAGIYSARANLNPVLFSGMQPGGQLTITSEVENWPGEPTGILGTELMEKLKAQAVRFGTQVIDDTIVKFEGTESPFKITTSRGQEYSAKAVIIATGASAKWLGVPGEERLQGRGVSACATCDGFFFRNKTVVVVGGGDSAMEEANFLTKFASQVTIINRSDVFKASKIMLERARSNSKIDFILNSGIVEVLGDEKVTAIKLKNLVTGEESTIPTDGFFVAIGHTPNTKLFQGLIDLDPVGYIITKPGSTKTSLPGLFAAGDVADKTYRQAITAAGTGCMAALDAERFLAHG